MNPSDLIVWGLAAALVILILGFAAAIVVVTIKAAVHGNDAKSAPQRSTRPMPGPEFFRPVTEDMISRHGPATRGYGRWNSVDGTIGTKGGR